MESLEPPNHQSSRREDLEELLQELDDKSEYTQKSIKKPSNNEDGMDVENKRDKVENKTKVRIC